MSIPEKLRQRKCPQCKERTLKVETGYIDVTGKVQFKRTCGCGYIHKTVEMTREQLDEVREGSRIRCPKCKSKTRAVGNSRQKFYYTRERFCRNSECGWNEKTYELSEKVFKALLKGAKLTKGDQGESDLSSGPARGTPPAAAG